MSDTQQTATDEAPAPAAADPGGIQRCSASAAGDRLEAINRRSDPTSADGAETYEQVRQILEDVRNEGNRAVVRYIKEFDGAKVAQSKLAVEPEQLEEAWKSLQPAQQKALEAAASNIRRYQEAIYSDQLKLVASFGRIVEMQMLPMRRVGIYVPGGLAPYPSTVLMTAIPARVAGVDELVVVTPPDKKGNPRPEVLAACHLVGVDKVYRVGGAQAIGALAYGTDTIPRVDLIAGPGNRYVAVAKQLVAGQVAIDTMAGPTELVIIADESARADWLAADMLAQAEHDTQAACVLLTTSAELAVEVEQQLEAQLQDLPSAETCRAALGRFGLLATCESIEEAVGIAEELAPEHLQVVTRAAELDAGKVRSAGATFVGPFSPEATGDYIAGPSHVLPTGGTARFSSGLSVFDFLLRRHRIHYQREGLKNELSSLAALARLEGFEAHARSAEIRFADDR